MADSACACSCNCKPKTLSQSTGQSFDTPQDNYPAVESDEAKTNLSTSQPIGLLLSSISQLIRTRSLKTVTVNAEVLPDCVESLKQRDAQLKHEQERDLTSKDSEVGVDCSEVLPDEDVFFDAENSLFPPVPPPLPPTTRQTALLKPFRKPNLTKHNDEDEPDEDEPDEGYEETIDVERALSTSMEETETPKEAFNRQLQEALKRNSNRREFGSLKEFEDKIKPSQSNHSQNGNLLSSLRCTLRSPTLTHSSVNNQNDITATTITEIGDDKHQQRIANIQLMEEKRSKKKLPSHNASAEADDANDNEPSENPFARFGVLKRSVSNSGSKKELPTDHGTIDSKLLLKTPLLKPVESPCKPNQSNIVSQKGLQSLTSLTGSSMLPVRGTEYSSDSSVRSPIELESNRETNYGNMPPNNDYKVKLSVVKKPPPVVPKKPKPGRKNANPNVNPTALKDDYETLPPPPPPSDDNYDDASSEFPLPPPPDFAQEEHFEIKSECADTEEVSCRVEVEAGKSQDSDIPDGNQNLGSSEMANFDENFNPNKRPLPAALSPPPPPPLPAFNPLQEKTPENCTNNVIDSEKRKKCGKTTVLSEGVCRDNMSSLLAEIRRGKELKRVSKQVTTPDCKPLINSLNAVLEDAMRIRRPYVEDSDSEGSFSEEDYEE